MEDSAGADTEKDYYIYSDNSEEKDVNGSKNCFSELSFFNLKFEPVAGSL